FLSFCGVYKIRGDVAAIELHPFNHFQLIVQCLPIFHGDHTIPSHLLHRSSHLHVAVGRYRGDLRDFLRGCNLFRHFLQFLDDNLHGLLYAAAHFDGVGAATDLIASFPRDGSREDGRRCRAVA
uniref:Uncharacterized protein n=1 Tax=Ciona savignyi TaxID=51511 RepID=H2Y7L9_CIOSA